MPFSLIYVLLLFTILFILLECKDLLKKRRWKEFTVSAVILLLAIVYGADYAMEWMLLPNPNWLLKILKPISEAFNIFFEISG